MSVTLDVDDEVVPGLDADGRPDPAYAERLGILPAPAGRRSAAFATDAAGFALLAIPTTIGLVQLSGPMLAAGGDVSRLDAAEVMPSAVLLIVGQGLTAVYGLVQLILHGRTGRTIGKAALGLRSVNVAHFGVPGFWRIVLRALTLWLAQLLLPLVGPAVVFASSSWDPERRGRSWLDRVGRCYLVDVRRGLDPRDAKALRHARRALEAGPVTDVPSLPSLASDRPVGDDLFIPSYRSSSGVVASAPDGAGSWTPPELVSSSATVAASTRATMPASTAPAPPVTDWVLEFDDGSRVVAAASGLLGRGPVAAPGEPADQLVPLIDESMRISKTHAGYGIDADGFWLCDRASRNGVVVTLPDGATRSLPPGVRTPVPAGARVTLGGRSFMVTHGSGR